MRALLRAYLRVSLVIRILAGFMLGSAIGVGLWAASSATGQPLTEQLAPWISPFGTIFVNMLKMIVIPVVFFSLVVGAANLPIKKFGRVGAKVIGFYLLTSLAAAVVGVLLALALDPGAGSAAADWQKLADAMGEQAGELVGKAQDSSLVGVFLSLFQNPFQALAEGNFLPMIVFALLFGLGTRVCIEASEDAVTVGRLEGMIGLVEAARDVIFRIVDWILEYAPIGVFALTVVNFGLYGPAIVGPYVAVVLGVVAGVAAMMLLVYPAMILALLRQNPLRFLAGAKEAMLTAFITRSSAATLPVSMKVAQEELEVRDELASFSLPLGATINMDGVCIHLPMFAVLAANMFGYELGVGALLALVITTVLAAVGAGGVPGGSLMLLFIILGNLGLSGEQVAVVVALALGVNPILDMFDTMNNVTGDLACTYVVAGSEGLTATTEKSEAALTS